MKNSILAIATGILALTSCSSELCEEVCVDVTVNKDAYLRSLSPDENYGNHPDNSAHSWTNGGQKVDVRAIMDFDFSEVPTDAIINQAKLNLYSYDSPANQHHSMESGSNSATLKVVTENWEENSVTWNNQPSISEAVVITLEETDQEIKHYENIDVTAWAQLKVSNPNWNNGLLFQLDTEEYYRKMLFASKDNTDEKLRPTMKVCYMKSKTLSTEEL